MLAFLFRTTEVGLHVDPSVFTSLSRSFALSRQPTPRQTPAGARLQQIRPAAAARGTVALQLPQRPLTATQRQKAAQMVPLPQRRYLAVAGRRPSVEAHPPPPQARQTLLPPLRRHREAGGAGAPEQQRLRQQTAGRAAGTILWWVRPLEEAARSAAIPTL